MRRIKDLDLANKRVLLRVDFNVPLGNDGQIGKKEDWRLRATLPTINYLLEQKAKIILLAHLGRPNGKMVETLRLNPIAQRLSKLLNKKVTKLELEEIRETKPDEIILLENLRFYPGEEANDSDFSKQLAEMGEVFVNDAFGVSHRAHASIVGLPKHLPSGAGLLLGKEIKNLSRVLNKSEHPLVVIIGGAKISTKIKVIKNFLNKADNLLLAGALANTVISAKGIDIGRSVVDKGMIDEVKKLELTNIKINIPVDVVASIDPSGKASSRIVPVGKTKEEEMILDIGPDTCELFKRIISRAKMIIWNGPMGLLEVEKFASGSKEVAQAVAQSSAFSVVGGGETITLLEELNLLDKINHVSTGGGAMLKFLAGEKLPGIEALK